MKTYIRLAWIGGLWLAATAPLFGQTPTIETDHTAYLPGEAIVASFTGGPGNIKDWIGIYPEGAVPGGPGSTLWRYVDNTTAGNVGLAQGSVNFPAGLSFAGPWTAFLLLNDGYEIAAQVNFTVLESFQPVVRRGKASYAPGEAISLTFTNGPANTKDWIGVYPEGVVPGSQNSTIWRYADNTTAGNTGLANGTVSFPAGLASAGKYVAYLLANDGYEILASEPIRVAAPVNVAPTLFSAQPANGAVDGTPVPRLTATVLSGGGTIAADGVTLKFDGAAVTPTVEVNEDRTTVRFQGSGLLPVGSQHTFELTARNTAGLSTTFTLQYTVGAYTDIRLPAPIALETFDAVTEGSLPAGWVGTTYSAVANEDVDFGNLDSAAYKGWTVVESDRFTGTFLTYSNPETPADEANDYKRVLNVGPFVVANGAPVTRLATGRMLFGNSGYRNGGSQFMVVETSDFDIAGKTDVHLAFNCLWEQNQDSMASVEYSTDRGTTWLPVVYFLNGPDIVRLEGGAVDAVATLTAELGDIALFDKDNDGFPEPRTYGSFIGASVTADLAPFIEARVDDNPTDGKRIEVRRLAAAAGKATVRFRLAHAGTDSWYFGIDNFGLYSIPVFQPAAPTLSAALEGGALRVTWPASATGYVLEQRGNLTGGDWTVVPGVTGNSALIPATTDQQWLRLRR